MLLPLLGVLLAQADHGAESLDVEAVALRLGIDVADVVGDGLLLLLEPLDTLDEGLQLVLGETGLGGFGLLFFDGGHQTLLMRDRAETVPAVSPGAFENRAAESKARPHPPPSSTAKLWETLPYLTAFSADSTKRLS